MKPLFLLLLCLTAASAQTAAPRSLEDLRSTYVTALKKLHGPVLQEYLAELQKQSSSSALSATDRAALDAETARVQSLVSGSGILEPLKKPSGPGTASPNRAPGILLTLEPHEVEEPKPSITPGEQPTVLLGSGTWRCKRIPAGSYDLIARFEASPLPPEATITVKLGDSFTHTTKPLSPPPPSAFGKPRILRLATLKLEADLTDTTLQISTSPPTAWLRLRAAFLAKVK